MWSKVYSQGNSDVTAGGAMTAMTAWDLRQRFQHVPKGKKVCFRDLAIGIYGPAAPVTVASWDTPCKHTALVRAYSDYVIRGLQLQGSTHYARPSPSDTIVVTYMARRPSREWPEKKYCDSEHSFFLCHLWEGFGERRLGRMVSNDQEVVKALKGLEGATMGGGKKIVVQDVDYNILTFEQQIATDLATDVMIGPHGAGLMHSVFMRDRAVLVELFVGQDAQFGARRRRWCRRTAAGARAWHQAPGWRRPDASGLGARSPPGRRPAMGSARH